MMMMPQFVHASSRGFYLGNIQMASADGIVEILELPSGASHEVVTVQFDGEWSTSGTGRVNTNEGIAILSEIRLCPLDHVTLFREKSIESFNQQRVSVRPDGPQGAQRLPLLARAERLPAAAAIRRQPVQDDVSCMLRAGGGRPWICDHVPRAGLRHPQGAAGQEARRDPGDGAAEDDPWSWALGWRWGRWRWPWWRRRLDGRWWRWWR